ncbi:hypothetical protein I6F11_25165 [Ensifer sp. NBAIM29]|nr:hypothetical protein [Ensifer sp. NBAIM29]
MEKPSDTFVDLGRGTPAWFMFAARILPVGILGQFLSAGLALFRDSSLWGLHATLGGALSFPAASLVAGALFVSRLRGFGWWAGLTFLLYLLQVILAAGSMPLLLSFHPVNGAFLLAASLVLLANVERRRSQSLAEDNATDKPGK